MSGEVRHFEIKMKTASNRWLLNIFMAIIIFYFAEMSRILGLHSLPLAVSAAWPATGFSLAAILLLGYSMCPGILLGNLCYNFLHLYSYDYSFIPAFITSFVISTGSLLESVFGAYVMRRFASPNYFSTVKDVIIFLVPASGFGCLFAATLGTAALAIFGNLGWDKSVSLWTVFFVGDLMGVYIFTPLIVVWMTSQPVVKLRNHLNEVLFMFLFFLIISFLSFIKDYPFAHFYIPLAMWISYRFRLHGATIAICLISFISITYTSMGMGMFNTTINSSDRLSLLVSFLEIIVAISLVVSTLANERESVIHLLEHQNVELRQTMQLHVEAIKEMAKEVIIKKKLTSIGVITSNLANYLHMLLNKITASAKSCLTSLREMEILDQQADKFDQRILNIFEKISQDLKTICRYGSNADGIAIMIQVQATLSEQKKTKAKSMHLNTLLNFSLNQAFQEMNQQYHEFSCVLTRDFDKSVTTFLILPEDLAHVFIKLFENAFHSMKQKRDLHKHEYTPKLEVRSIDHENSIEIIIQDNGLGMSVESARNLFQSFIESSDSNKEIINIDLSLARDIIVSVYGGEIRAESVKGEYFRSIVTLPKDLLM